MSIQILSVQSNTEPLTGETTRHAEIIITSGGSDSYLWSVGGLPAEGDLQAILEAREAELLAAAIAAGVEPNAPEVEERIDFAGMEADIATELAWIGTARTDIASGITLLDSGATLAQTRGVVKGLAQIVDRVLREQEGEFKAWRFVIRRLG
jgi:hypothetical protein